MSKNNINSYSNPFKRYTGKMLLVESKNCPSCKEYETYWKEEIEKGEVIPIKVEDSEELKNLCEALDVKHVPCRIEIDEEKGKVVACLFNDEGEVERCVEIYEG